MKKDLSITMMIVFLVQGSYSRPIESKVPCVSEEVVPPNPEPAYDTNDSEEMPDGIICPEDEEHDIGLSKDDHEIKPEPHPDDHHHKPDETLNSSAFGDSNISNLMIGLVAMALF
jgi:hypothetical protein